MMNDAFASGLDTGLIIVGIYCTIKLLIYFCKNGPELFKEYYEYIILILALIFSASVIILLTWTIGQSIQYGQSPGTTIQQMWNGRNIDVQAFHKQEEQE